MSSSISRQRLWAGAWLLVLPVLPATAHPFDPFAEEKQVELQRVVEYMRQGNLHEALIQVDQAIALFPKHGPFHTLKAQLFLKLDKWELAQLAADRAIELAPEYPFSYWIRGLIHQQQRRPADAIADFNRLLELEDHNRTLMSQAVGSRGMALVDLGRHDEALGDLNRALEVRPEAIAERQFRASALLGLGRLSEAETDLKTLLALEPDNPAFLKLQAELLIQRQEAAKAVLVLDRLLTRHPRDAQAFRVRARAHQQLGDTSKSRADRAKACEYGLTQTCGH